MKKGEPLPPLFPAGIGLLLANRPFCLTMFEDGVKGADVEERPKPKDIAELLAERLPA